jgi:hypothetical protein
MNPNDNTTGNNCMKFIIMAVCLVVLSGCITDSEYHQMMLEERAKCAQCYLGLYTSTGDISYIQGQDIVNMSQFMETGRGWLELR